MEYGTIIRNYVGKVNIDSSYNNHSYYDNDTTTLTSGMNIISINPISKSLVLLTQPNTTSFIRSFGFTDTVTSGTFNNIKLLSSAPCDCKWMLYKEGSTITGDYGLKIRDENNNAVFNSNEIGYTNIVDYYSYRVTSGNINNYTDITVDNTDNYFQFMGGNYELVIQSGSYILYTLGIKKIDATKIRVGYIPFMSGSTTNTTNFSFSLLPRMIIEIKPPPSL